MRCREGPRRRVGRLFSIREIARVVIKKLQPVFIPLQRINVKTRPRRIHRDSPSLAVAFGMVVSRAVDVRVDFFRLETNVFQDVDLPAGRPARLRHVVPERPHRRPGASPGRDLRPHLDPPVEKRALAHRRQAGRRDGPPLPVVAPRFDHQHAAFHARVFPPPRRVILRLAVSHIALLRLPHRRVGRARAVKLLRPRQRPPRRIEFHRLRLRIGRPAQGSRRLRRRPRRLRRDFPKLQLPPPHFRAVQLRVLSHAVNLERDKAPQVHRIAKIGA